GILRDLGYACSDNTVVESIDEIALIERGGGCTFADKIKHANGSVGVILYNNVSSSNISNVDSLDTDVNLPPTTSMPAFYVSNEIGIQLLYSLNASNNANTQQSNQHHAVRVMMLGMTSSPGSDGSNAGQTAGNRFTYFIVIVITIFVAYMLFKTRRRQQEIHSANMLRARLPSTQDAKQKLLDPKILADYPSKPYASRKKMTEKNPTSLSLSSSSSQQADGSKSKTRSVAENEDEHTETDKNADVDKDQDFETCAVCLEDFVETEQVKELPCAHIYHPNCIERWLTKVSGVCPMCKYDCVNNKAEENDDPNKEVVISMNDGEPSVVSESSAQQSTSMTTINIAADFSESSESKKSRELRTREENDNNNREKKDNIAMDPNEHAGDENITI
ncbi:439_t:CDS:2, partial [Ambispora leptoticha]